MGNESGVKAQTNNFNIVINNVLNIFEQNINNILHRRKIKIKFIDIFIKDHDISQWLDEEQNCIEHSHIRKTVYL